MRINKETPKYEDIVILLDGKLANCVVEADDEEGWVDELIKHLDRPQDAKIVRRIGKVTFHGVEEAYAQTFELFAQRIRSGEMKISHLTMSMPSERWWSKDKWEYFKTQDTTFGISYHNPDHQAKELARKEAYLKENPDAENYGVIPPISPS